MSDTPRLRSAWPPTPASDQKKPANHDEWTRSRAGIPPLPPPAASSTPTIPFSILDAPSQRFYVSLVYLVIHVWRIYDYLKLVPDGDDSFWLFTKWVGIDTAFLYSLAGLNIPWLQWSSSTFTMLFIGHSVINWLLMFQVPVSIQGIPDFLMINRTKSQA